MPREEASAFGVMAIDDARKITSFLEKPADPPPMPGKEQVSLASMGIYVFNAEYLYKVLDDDLANPASSHDFGKDVIPRIVAEGRALAHPFGMSCIVNPNGAPPYWRDVGTIDAFWAANLDLASINPELDIYDTEWPIWTHQRQLPPAKFVPNHDGTHGIAVNTIVSGGCIVSGSHVTNAVFFSNVRVHSFCSIDQAVVLPGVTIARNCRLRKVVLDRGCKLPEGLVVGEDAALDCGPLRTHRRRRGADHARNAGPAVRAQAPSRRRAAALRVLHVGAEIFPLLKTGGLADVLGALPGALVRAGADARVLLPAFPALLAALRDVRDVGSCAAPWGGAPAQLLTGHFEAPSLAGVPIYLLRSRCALRPPRQPLQRRRRGALSRQPPPLRAARLGGLAAGRRPRPRLAAAGGAWPRLACRPGARVPGVLAGVGASRAATVFTVHNLAYQGLFPPSIFAELGLPAAAYTLHGVEFHDQLSFMKAGLHYADRLTTVSPTYAREIQGAELGCGLDGLLRARASVLSGILNGVDEAVWNPATDAPSHSATAPSRPPARPPARPRFSASAVSRSSARRRCSRWSAA